jgi:uncharacterized protein YceK
VRRRPVLLGLLLGVVFALAIAGVASVLATRGSQEGPASAEADQQEADVAAGQQEASQWSELQITGLALPVSDVHGPFDTSRGQAQGFSRDEMGAVLAGLHVGLRASPGVGRNVFEPTIREQVTGAATDVQALLERVTSEYEAQAVQHGTLPGQPLPDQLGSYEGYRIGEFTDDAAIVYILVRGPDPSGGTVLSEARVDLRWEDGDWRLVAPPDANFDGYGRLDPDPAEFQPFPNGEGG